MPYKQLSESEIASLSKEQRIAYEKEAIKYKERCAFINRLEQLESVKIPEIKPQRELIKRINVNNIYDIKTPEITGVILNNNFSGILSYSGNQFDEVEKIKKSLYETENDEETSSFLPDVVIPELPNRSIESAEEYKVKLPSIGEISRNVYSQISNICITPFELEHVSLEQNFEAPIVNKKVTGEIKMDTIENIYITQPRKPDIKIPDQITTDLVNVNICNPAKINFSVETQQVALINQVSVLKPDYAEIKFSENNKILLNKIEVSLPETNDIQIPENDKIVLDKTQISLPEMNMFSIPENNEIQLNKEVNIPPDIQFLAPEQRNIEMPEIQNLHPDSVDIQFDNSQEIDMEPCVVIPENINHKIVLNDIEIVPLPNVGKVESTDFVFERQEISMNKTSIVSIGVPQDIIKEADDTIQKILNRMEK